MSGNRVNPYNIDIHIAELYDQLINNSEDVTLILDLIGNAGPLYIFEPFCGTGRILIPLVDAGHQLTGMDQSTVLLDRCREKLANGDKTARLIVGNVVDDPWQGMFDLVIMGGNCLYELASLEEQEGCIRSAASALKRGGYLFLDNDHMEGGLAQAWQDTAVKPGFPSGLCKDGVRLESTIQTIWFNEPARLARFERKTKTVFPDGRIDEQVFIQQKHPVSTHEVSHWLEKHGFTIERLYGDWSRQTYSDASPRAIFWARKR